MLLQNKIAIVHGAGGAIGSATAKAFAKEGAKVFLAGRTLEKAQRVAQEIIAAGGAAEAVQVDALNEQAVEAFTNDVVKKAGALDILFNAIGLGTKVVQGQLLTDLKPEDFLFPITNWTLSQFLTARAAARHMVTRRSGVILTLSASPARLAIAQTCGFGVACAAVEGLSRTLAAELSPHGVRVVNLRPHRIADTLNAADFPAVQYSEFKDFLEKLTLLKRMPTLAEVADTAVFLASDKGGAISGATMNLTCGMDVD